jgi:site-specific recombinase XerD
MRTKRYTRHTIEYLDHSEVESVLTAPDLSTWIGRRDRALLMVAIQTGLRMSELTGLKCRDVVFGAYFRASA